MIITNVILTIMLLQLGTIANHLRAIRETVTLGHAGLL